MCLEPNPAAWATSPLDIFRWRRRRRQWAELSTGSLIYSFCLSYHSSTSSTASIGVTLEMPKLKVSSVNYYVDWSPEIDPALGFTTDIGVAASDLNLAVSLFFITFVLFQPISSAIGRRVGAKHWIPFIMVGQNSHRINTSWRLTC